MLSSLACATNQYSRLYLRYNMNSVSSDTYNLYTSYTADSLRNCLSEES